MDQAFKHQNKKKVRASLLHDVLASRMIASLEDAL